MWQQSNITLFYGALMNDSSQLSTLTVCVRIRTNPQHGVEPFGDARKEDMLALLQASEAIASAHLAPVNQMEWEGSVNWGEQETSSTQPASLVSPERRETSSITGAKQALLALLSMTSLRADLQSSEGTVDIISLCCDMHANLHGHTAVCLHNCRVPCVDMPTETQANGPHPGVDARGHLSRTFIGAFSPGRIAMPADLGC